MDISLKWLSKYVDISEYSPVELANKITVSGVEIESIKYLAQGTNLIIGQVIECEPHPDSDHLHVTKVNIGTEVLQIVCGAPNVAKGQKVIVSLPGAYLPAKDITIQKGSIRGVESNGMICSLLELGVDKKYLTEAQQNGIEVLGEDAKIGDTDPLGYLGLDDVIFELKPTPNRGDVLSVMSFAYELGAAINKKVDLHLDEIKFDKLEKSQYSVTSKTSNCHLFSIKGVRGVKVKESPKWLKEALLGCSIRSINNIVDIGNYVMLLTGQPLHMYDSDKLASKDFVVRDDFEQEYVALDETKYQVLNGDIVITNNNEISCIAGVMGGANTEVSDATINLAIEAAIFDSVQVRKTSTRLDLISDSSVRFVRGIDESRNLLALNLAAKLLVEYADAKVIEETVTFGEPVVNNKEIELTLSRVNGLLGTEFNIDEVKSVFDRLSFEYKQLNESSLLVKAPSYRKDIFDSEDLVEEVIRLLGFDRLTSTYPTTSNVGSLSSKQSKRNLIRNHFLINGINEAISYTLVSDKISDDFNCLPISKKEPVEILHPLTEEHKILRRSLIPSLLESIKYNNYHGNNDVSLFEISNVYTNDSSCKELLGVVLEGSKNRLEWNKNKIEEYSFYSIKGLLTSLFEKLGIDENRYQLVRVEQDNKFYHIGASCYIKIANEVVGVMGMIHPNMAKKYDISNAAILELDLDSIYNLRTSKIVFEAPSIYPSITRDIAIVIEKDIESAKVIKLIKKQGHGLVSNVSVFDEYVGEHIKEGFKSLALHITYHSDKETLKDNIINPVHEEIVKAINKEFGGELRG